MCYNEYEVENIYLLFKLKLIDGSSFIVDLNYMNGKFTMQ